jgi:hypothetical protein
MEVGRGRETDGSRRRRDGGANLLPDKPRMAVRRSPRSGHPARPQSAVRKRDPDADAAQAVACPIGPGPAESESERSE